MGVRVQSIITNGSAGTVVDIECHLSNNLPTIVIVGSASKSVDESRERIRGSFATSRIMLPRKRITINLAPADIPKADSGFDLAIAVAILVASDQTTRPVKSDQAFIGELGLSGETRAVRGIIGKILIGRAKGIQTFFIPTANLKQAQLVPEVTLIPIDNLQQLYDHLNLGMRLDVVDTGAGKYQANPVVDSSISLRLSEVVGQTQAKRALEIAAAGGHNVFFDGPPGTGKSMLAKALQSILPPLSREEMLEVTHLHSLASHDYEKIIYERPFRSPHHSSSHVAIVGGGTKLRPGEISLAHRGVLFFDELPEFSRDTLEALRQPLEDRVISLARARETAEYPASFIMVATANPCPCGYFGAASDACDCAAYDISRYRQRLSGPILDRIDLYSNVGEVDHDKLLAQEADPVSDQAILERVVAARRRQLKRYGLSSKLNADMNNQDVRLLAKLDPKATALLGQGANNLKISVRVYFRTIKVARTIADLDDSEQITQAHMGEAINYRYKPVTKQLQEK